MVIAAVPVRPMPCDAAPVVIASMQARRITWPLRRNISGVIMPWIPRPRITVETAWLRDQAGFGVILPLVDRIAVTAGDIFTEIIWLLDDEGAPHDQFRLYRVSGDHGDGRCVVTARTAAAGSRVAGKECGCADRKQSRQENSVTHVAPTRFDHGFLPKNIFSAWAPQRFALVKVDALVVVCLKA